MKTTIEIEIPEYSDASELREIIENEIGNRVYREVEGEGLKAAREMIAKAAAAQIDKIVEEAINVPVALTSIYGEKRKGQAVTLREEIIKIAEERLKREVHAKNGGRTVYNESSCTAVEFLVKAAVREAVQAETAQIAKIVKSQVLAATSKWLAENGATAEPEQK